MNLDNRDDDYVGRLHYIACAMTGLSSNKIEKIKTLYKSWKTYKREGKGFANVYNLCVEVGVELSNAQRDAHVDPINGLVNITKFHVKESYHLSDVAEALDMFRETMTTFDSDVNAIQKKQRRRNGRYKSQDAATRRLRSDAKI